MVRTTAAPPARGDDGAGARGDVSARLLRSAAALAYDPATEVDWETPLDEACTARARSGAPCTAPPTVGEMSEEQRIRSSPARRSARSCRTGIWFEMILQQMLLRDQSTPRPDERRRPVRADRDRRRVPALDHVRAGRQKHAASRRTAPHAARGGAGPGVQDPGVRRGGVRGDPRRRGGPRRHAARLDARTSGSCPSSARINNIHVVEESRHMKFARAETRRHLSGAGPVRRADQRAGHRDRVVRHRHQHGQQGRLRQRPGSTREARSSRRRRPTSTTGR